MGNSDNYSKEEFNDELSLRDIFLALWRHKVLIIIITIAAALVAAVYSLFYLKPVYHARLNMIISMPETLRTKYGEYVMPISTNDQYINLITSNEVLKNTIEVMGYDGTGVTIEGLRNRISVAKTSNNSFEISVAAGNPEEAKQLAEALYNNYIGFLDVMVFKGVVEYYIDYYTVQISSLKVELETNKELLERYTELLKNIPMTTNRKEALDSIKSAGEGSNIIIMENVINPNYIVLELDIINIKQTINEIESNIDMYNSLLKELEAKKTKLDEYNNTGEFDEISDNIIRVSSSNVYLISKPVEPSRKTSPNNFRNILIGAILGGMTAVLIALIKEFWFKRENRTQ